MLATVTQIELCKILNHVCPIASKKSPNPILNNVLLSARDGALYATASDREMTVQSKANAIVEIPGEITVSAKLILDLVKEFPPQEVTLNTLLEGRLKLICGKSHYVLASVSAGEFPTFQSLYTETECQISANILSDLISSTLYAASNDETRTHLYGCYFESVTKELDRRVVMVGTDGMRLAVCSANTPKADFNKGVIIPRRGLHQLKRLLEDCKDSVIDFSVTEEFFVAKNSVIKIAIQLADGVFPNYKYLVPKGNGTKLTVKKDLFVQALKRVAIVAEDKAGSCFDLKISPTTLKIQGSGQIFGSAEEVLECTYEGGTLEISFGSKFLLEAITNTQAKNDFINIVTFGEEVPILIFGSDDLNSFNIVIPAKRHKEDLKEAACG